MPKLTINLPDDIYAKLKAMADRSGLSLEEYIGYTVIYRYSDWINQHTEWND